MRNVTTSVYAKLEWPDGTVTYVCKQFDTPGNPLHWSVKVKVYGMAAYPCMTQASDEDLLTAHHGGDA